MWMSHFFAINRSVVYIQAITRRERRRKVNRMSLCTCELNKRPLFSVWLRHSHYYSFLMIFLISHSFQKINFSMGSRNYPDIFNACLAAISLPGMNFRNSLSLSQRWTSCSLTMRSVSSLMKGGSLELIFGPMFSGKTTELLRRMRRYKFATKSCLLIKYRADVRYNSAEGDATTHDLYVSNFYFFSFFRTQQTLMDGVKGEICCLPLL